MNQSFPSQIEDFFQEGSRAALQDVSNLLCSMEPREPAPSLPREPAPSLSLWSAAVVIEDNGKLLVSVNKAGRLALKLARLMFLYIMKPNINYFCESVMRANTLSGLNKEKLREIKAKLRRAYHFANPYRI